MLEIKLLGNPKKVRKDVRCFCFDKVVDSDTTNLKDLVDEITDMYPPGYLEVAHVQYYDEDLKNFPVVNTDQELMLMFQKHSNSKVVHMFIAYSDPSGCYEPIIEWEGYPSNSNQFSEPEPTIPSSSTQANEETSTENPITGNEHVGVDEEGLYLKIKHVLDLTVVACNKKQDYVPEDEDEHEDEVSEDDEEFVGAAHGEPITYSRWHYLSMQSNMNLSIILSRVHRIDARYIVQGKWKINVPGGCMLHLGAGAAL